MVAEAVARRGIALLCEKPLAHSVAAAEAIVAAVEAGGVPWMSRLLPPLSPPVLAIKEQLAAGAIGAPILFRNRFAGRFSWGGADLVCRPRPLRRRRPDGYQRAFGGPLPLPDRRDHRGGRAAFTGGPGLASTRVEHSGALLVNGPGGVPGVIEASWVTPTGGSVLAIYGTEGTLSVDYGAGNFGVAYLQRADDPAPRELPLRGPSRFTAEVGHLLECLAAGRAPSPDAHDGLRAVQVLMAAYAAAGGATATLPLPAQA